MCETCKNMYMEKVYTALRQLGFEPIILPGGGTVPTVVMEDLAQDITEAALYECIWSPDEHTEG